MTTEPAATDAAGAPADVTAKAVEVAAGAVAVETTSDVAETSVPEVPVIVTVVGKKLAELLAVRVNTLEPAVAGSDEKLAVTPLGNPVATKVTLLLNPLTGVT